MRNYFSCSLLFTNDLFPQHKMLHETLPTDRNRRTLLGLGHWERAGAKLRKQQAVPRRKGSASPFRAAMTKPPQGPALYWASVPCRTRNTVLLHKTLSTRSSFLWSHSGPRMGEDWTCPMKATLLQNPIEQQNPEFRKWRHVTLLGEGNNKITLKDR